MDFLSDNGETNEIKFNLPYNKFKLNWEGSDYILEYDSSQVIITGYEKEVKLIFSENNENVVTTVILSHNSIDSKTPNITVNENSQISQIEIPSK